jgi:hypothetical protein
MGHLASRHSGGILAGLGLIRFVRDLPKVETMSRMSTAGRAGRAHAVAEREPRVAHGARHPKNASALFAKHQRSSSRRIDKRFEVYGEIISLFGRETFTVSLPDATGPDWMPVTCQSLPAIPRLLIDGVRFEFQWCV